MQCLGGGDKLLVVVDYVYIFDVLEKVLEVLCLYVVVCLLCLFGCGGDCDVGKCLLMVVIVECLVDGVLVIDDNLCIEVSVVIIVDICKGFVVVDKVIFLLLCGEVIVYLIVFVVVDDVVFLVGKGYEDYQEIDGVCYLFFDIEQVECVLVVWEVLYV